MKAAMTMPKKMNGPKIIHPPVANPPVVKNAMKSPKKEKISARAPCIPNHPNQTIEAPAVRMKPMNIIENTNITATKLITIAQVVFQGTTTHTYHGIQQHQHRMPLIKSQPSAGRMQIGLKYVTIFNGNSYQIHSTLGATCSFIVGWQLAFRYAYIDESLSLVPNRLALFIMSSKSLMALWLRQYLLEHLPVPASKPYSTMSPTSIPIFWASE